MMTEVGVGVELAVTLKTCKTPVKSTLSSTQVFYRSDAVPVDRPTGSVKANVKQRKERYKMV